MNKIAYSSSYYYWSTIDLFSYLLVDEDATDEIVIDDRDIFWNILELFLTVFVIISDVLRR